MVSAGYFGGQLLGEQMRNISIDHLAYKLVSGRFGVYRTENFRTANFEKWQAISTVTMHQESVAIIFYKCVQDSRYNVEEIFDFIAGFVPTHYDEFIYANDSFPLSFSDPNDKPFKYILPASVWCLCEMDTITSLIVADAGIGTLLERLSSLLTVVGKVFSIDAETDKKAAFGRMRAQTSPIVAIKASVYEMWEAWKAKPKNYKTVSEFALDMLEKFDELKNPNVIAGWCTQWAKERPLKKIAFILWQERSKDPEKKYDIFALPWKVLELGDCDHYTIRQREAFRDRFFEWVREWNKSELASASNNPSQLAD